MRKSTRDAMLAEVNAAKAIADTASREERDLTDVEIDTCQKHVAKATKLREDDEKAEAFTKQFADLTAGLGISRENDPGFGATNTPAPARKSAGEVFATSPEYKALIASAPNGAFSEKSRVQSSPVALPGGMKQLFYSGDTASSAGPLLVPQHLGMLAPFYGRPLKIRQLFSTGTTNTDTLDYVRMVSVNNNASVVPEARSAAAIDGTTVTNLIGGLKPQSWFTFERDSTTVKTIAHWTAITKRALSDAAQMRTLIDNFLQYGLEEEFEDQLIGGSGTGENFLGLANTPGVQTQAAPGAGEDNLDILKRARTKVQIGGRTIPTAYLMNPLDWESIELMRDDMGRFYGSGPFSLTQPSLWGLPVVTSEAVPLHTAWVADWNYGTIWDREQSSVQATDTHADFFVRNLVAILAEFRAAFTILRPPAFVKITLA